MVLDRTQDIDINLNAPEGSVTLYVSAKDGSFPTETKHDYKSTDGLVFINANDIKDSKHNVLILVKRNSLKKQNGTSEL